MSDKLRPYRAIWEASTQVAWLVRQGKKGHFPEALHIALVEQILLDLQ